MHDSFHSEGMMLYRPPEAFLARMRELLGEQFEAFLQTYNLPPKTGLRINPLKVGPGDRVLGLTFSLKPVPGLQNGFTVPEGAVPGKHPYHAAGLYYLQDPSAMVVAELLGAEPGERVLDLSAAPGGKTTHLASLMRGQGVLVANEIHPRRVLDLVENVERWGARNVVITQEQPERLAAVFEGYFDRVLVDAPCSGEGMFRKSEAARSDWGERLVHSCAQRQAHILNAAAFLVRPGGLLAYSTCTFSPEENEGAVSRFLAGHPDFSLAEVASRPGFEPGRPEWAGHGHRRAELLNAVRLWPHRGPWEGHFIALLRRGEGSGKTRGRAWSPIRPRKFEKAACRGFWDQHVASDLRVDHLTAFRSHLCLLAESDLPDLSRLRVIRPGWLLGQVVGDRFIPNHALAMGLGPGEVKVTVDLAADSREVRTYLRGEILRMPGEEGWLMITVDGYPLGWGKRVGGVIKNHFPRRLRWP